MIASRQGSVFAYLKSVVLLVLTVVLLVSCGGKNIEGIVVDPFGRGVEGVAVQVATTTFSTVTDSRGQYEVDYVPGKIKLVFAKQGYTTHEIQLDIQQKSKFPAESLTIYPIPGSQGLYLLTDTGLVKQTLFKSTVVSESRADWDAMNGSVRVPQFKKLPEKKVILPVDSLLRFVDFQPVELSLMKQGQNGTVQMYRRSPTSTKTSYDGTVLDSVYSVGTEKLKIRQVRLSQGLYAWVETFYNEWTERRTVKNDGYANVFLAWTEATRSERAAIELDRILTLKDDMQKELEGFLRNLNFVGTESMDKAAMKLKELRGQQ